MERFDIAVIGAGPGGYVAAIYAARLGKKVCVIEKAALGGTCLNRGCIPTKAILSSVEALGRIKEAPAFGIEIGPYKVDFGKINSRKDEIVKRLRQGIEILFKARKITLVAGAAKFLSADTIEVAGQVIEAQAIIIATGSVPLEIPAFKFNHNNIISSDDILQLNEIPDSLLIIGGGVIGCEFAAIYNALGCKVTIVEMMDEILPNMDREIAKKLNLLFKKRGIDTLTSIKVEQFKEIDGRISAVLSSGKEVSAQKALIAVGRKPNSDNLGIETLGAKLEKGRIVTNEFMATSAPSLYAIGDVASRLQLAHVASYEGIIAVENICGNKRQADYRSTPSCIYTDPEIASVGITEQAARASALNIKIARFPFLSLGKAHVAGRTEGLVKLIAQKESSRILGVHILGADATNLIAEAALAIKKGLTVEEVAETIHAHPTLSEGLMEACHIFQERGIHTI